MNDLNKLTLKEARRRAKDGADVCGRCPSTGYQRCATSADACDRCDCSTCCRGITNKPAEEGQKDE